MITMLLVKFKVEVKGVLEVSCHHVTTEIQKGKYLMVIHFTKLIKWVTDFDNIELIGCQPNGQSSTEYPQMKQVTLTKAQQII